MIDRILTTLAGNEALIEAALLVVGALIAAGLAHAERLIRRAIRDQAWAERVNDAVALAVRETYESRGRAWKDAAAAAGGKLDADQRRALMAQTLADVRGRLGKDGAAISQMALRAMIESTIQGFKTGTVKIFARKES